MVDRKVHWIISPSLTGGESLLLFSACDAGYLGYAISLIRSVDLYSPGYAFVLHIINPAPDSLERVDKLVANLSATRLFVSCEYIDLASLDSEQKRAYYASARFPQLAKLLGEYSVPIFSIDADSLVMNPIDMNFSDKIDAEVVILRRDLLKEMPEHLSVLNSSIFFKPLPAVVDFLGSIAEEIDKHFQECILKWFVDQVVFFRKMKEFNKLVKFYNIKSKYVDWEFGEASIVWAAKGGRKLYDMRFFIMQALLSDDNDRRRLANKVVANLFAKSSDSFTSEWMHGRLASARETVTRIALYIPRLDLPWKRGVTSIPVPPVLADDVIDLRLHWKEFALRLANAIERAGVPVDVIEIPAWEIDRRKIEEGCSALALVPHRCHLDFERGTTPVMFYMQEFFRWVFVVNENGWSAASSAYPVSFESLLASNEGGYDRYRSRLLDGSIGSKFSQIESKPKRELLDTGLIPASLNSYGAKTVNVRPYIFFPLQIPTDQSIKYFSSISEFEVIEAIVNWARKRGVAIVIKPHPANKKSMVPFERYVDDITVFYSNANVHDLIEHSVAVYTINSGVGFEALLQTKPVVTFGRVEYDCVTFNATLDNLDQAWEYSKNTSRVELESKYRCFVNWFLGEYAVDMSQPDLANARLNELAAGIVAKARNYTSKGAELSKG